MSVKNKLFTLAGFLLLGIGAVGMIIPILPTTPFVITASACFSGNPRVRAWLMKNRFFAEYITNYNQRTGLRKKTVAISLGSLWITLFLSMLVIGRLWAILLLSLIGIAVTVHILRIASPKRKPLLIIGRKISMINEKVTQALNDQVNAEIYSAYLYLAMSSWSDRMGLKGFAHWFYVQFQEEIEHGLHMHQYILERGGKPIYAAIDAPPAEFDSIVAAFEKTLEHEQYVSERINHIASLAMRESDHATYQFIMWYVNEQVEEESSANDILQKLKLIEGNTSMLLALDTELSARVFLNPFTNTKA